MSDHAVFTHLSTPRAAAYRAVLGAFAAAKERFRLHLRPEEVFAALDEAGRSAVGGRDGLDQVLAALGDWGNLIATADSAEVRSVEDFYRARFLYQLSKAGEAAEEALAFFHQHLAEPGALQTAALADLRGWLGELAELLAEDPATWDAPRLHRIIGQCFQRLDSLAAQARAFLGSLQRAMDLHGGGVGDFLAYKEHLVGYLERFLRELTAAGADIAARLGELDRLGMSRALVLAAERELADRLRQDAAERAELELRWLGRWDGLRAWFLGGAGGERSQAALLRERTRAAIPLLLSSLAHLHDRRMQRADRPADLRELARWFAACPDDAEAHRLWHAAFCLTPARHLGIDQATLDARSAAGERPGLPWAESLPIALHPRLRSAGRVRNIGRPPVVLDHQLAKEHLLAQLADEAAAFRAALSAIADGRLRKLSELPSLDERTFAVLLDCLGAVLARHVGSGAITCVSGDGSLAIRAVPVPGAPPVTLRCASGELTGPEFELAIGEVLT